MNRESKLLEYSLGSRVRGLWSALSMPLIAIVFGLAVGALVIGWSGSNPIEGITSLLAGGYGSPYSLTTTLTRATPIIFAGLASSLAWGSGYETMGIAGQMTLGAFVSSIVAVNCPGPGPVVLIVSMLAGMLTGMVWSLLAAWISDRFEAYLLIVTLMLNYVAENIASYFTTYVFKDPFASDNLAVQTQKIEETILPRLFPGFTLHTGFILAVCCVAALLFLMRKTSFGYDARMTGLNPRFARYGGVHSKRNMYLTLMLSGAIAGLGGAVEVLGTRYRFIDEMITSPGYAWGGITASLMSNNHPVGVMVSSVFLAGLTTGGAAIERSMNIPQEITSIIQGVLTVFVTARFVWKRRGKTGVKRERGGARHANES